MDGMAAGEPVWRTHSRRESGVGIEVGVVGDVALIRSSLDPDCVVTLTRDEWLEFLTAVKDGDFDRI
jgi:hypothetical protein